VTLAKDEAERFHDAPDRRAAEFVELP